MKLRNLKHTDVYPNPDQPRKVFDADKLAELAESIKVNGLQQPIKVCPDSEGRFKIVCGERRWRAHGLAGLEHIQAIVEVMTDDALADAAIIENLQRLDITPLEEAHAFQGRLDAGVSLDELAQRLGVSVRQIEFRLMLLRLDVEFQDAFAKGLLDRYQANLMSQVGKPFQHLVFKAIRDGKCKTRTALRAVVHRLSKAEGRGDTADAFELADHEAETGENQSTMFANFGPTEAERAALTSLETKIEKVTELLCAGYEDNEVVAAGKVSAARAATTVEQLHLLEKQIRKMRMAIETSAALAGVKKTEAA